jgi:RimJ/RimL family protein N-acetyltransferase
MPVELLIKSGRLFLRPVNLQDSPSIYGYRSNPTVNQYQGWIPETIDDVHDFITNQVSSEIDIPDTWFQLAILKKNTHELIGDLGIHFLKSESFHAELGCTLDVRFQGNGFAFEALSELIRYLFEALGKQVIIACIDPRNEKSISLFERLGFSLDVAKEKNTAINPDWPDDLVYVIRREEWSKSHTNRL